MPPNSEDLMSYLIEVKNSYSEKDQTLPDFESFDKLPLNDLECMYTFDFSANKIRYHQGFDTVFGHHPEALDMSFIFEHYHPEDKPYIQSIVKSVVHQLMAITIPEYSNVLNMSYRFKKADNTYANILSNTIIYKTDDRDKVQQVLIKYTDISFTSESDAVEWSVDETYMKEEQIKERVYGHHMIFTEREKEVIRLIFEGASNNDISIDLHISKHTVATHRKNILLKSNCHDTNQLKEFCKKKGICF
ncbi:response regulator transcription factor [Lutimonas zeaxanthinifaciens]|uniref:response regulator transcription factor n=1 Tax=Lutimonas zeaxanthinifaciens TaxID=3060215 RepID=UPI00265CD3D3|nr:helix-turn-helix transcriptional regulator [Lutimonas sp. YSD2104]WKK66312.1 helix-turn-helix transcriptional regulator [Lutimonas sp. YSD2104]